MNPAADVDPARVEAETRAWVRRAVIGLGLCPFAGAADARGLVRYVVSDARDIDALLDDLVAEIHRIADADPSSLETTLLIHPHVLNDFDDYNDFLDIADAALDELDLTGELQVASFHPDYRFADTDEDDVTNASNRSPYPLLQLLREASIERAIDSGLDTDAVVEANLETLERLGHPGWDALKAAFRRDAELELQGTRGSAGGSDLPPAGLDGGGCSGPLAPTPPSGSGGDAGSRDG
ncbi:DUF1415 family protein [Piscinibacter koreensis]|uniref:DUF1415 domain-containing protein n=1 Tax=Piscinibacter koreensis TaxID=2742824 RepID=A0A7Y6NK35_9BURK|nr:DUF1415 domain-containing protein [Schlegelella koreensis]